MPKYHSMSDSFITVSPKPQNGYNQTCTIDFRSLVLELGCEVSACTQLPLRAQVLAKKGVLNKSVSFVILTTDTWFLLMFSPKPLCGLQFNLVNRFFIGLKFYPAKTMHDTLGLNKFCFTVFFITVRCFRWFRRGHLARFVIQRFYSFVTERRYDPTSVRPETSRYVTDWQMPKTRWKREN